MIDHVVHISLGPVQSFIAQARRTRDLWAGSFLLSWMTGQLMATVLHQGGRIIFPKVGDYSVPEDPMLAAILGKPVSGHENPRIGTLPNRFKAIVEDEFNPETVANEMQQKWLELAEAVWQSFVAKASAEGRETRAIWERQIDGFWDIQWVMGADPADGSDAVWLDLRKNCRSHWPPPEGGDHCTTMSEWQELSGYSHCGEKRQQQEFWSKLRCKTGRLDLREDERLCSIALIKRLFPKLEDHDQDRIIGWRIGTVNWPSTAYMATVPWLMHVAADPQHRKALENYVQVIRETLDSNTFIKLCGESAVKLPGLRPLGESANLDGNMFLDTALANQQATPLNDQDVPHAEGVCDAALRENLRESLAKAVKIVNGSAQSFYAYLLLDGDRLGKLLSEHDQETVSSALERFVKEVPNAILKHNGVTVYAGGDDVLAMLPVNSAIECAIELREHYGSSFARSPAVEAEAMLEQATASCAIVFTHFRNPLRDVIALAHRELDHTAKTRNGRNSLAVTVMNAGGVNHRWVGKFGNLPNALLSLRDAVASDSVYSTNFFYRLRERYARMIADADKFNPNDLRDIILAEYKNGEVSRDDLNQKLAEDAVDTLLEACHNQQGKYAEDNSTTFQLDAAFISLFLAQQNSFSRTGKQT